MYLLFRKIDIFTENLKHMARIDYNKELEDLERFLREEQYEEVVRNVGWIFEMALKELYRLQIDFFELNKDNEILVKEYRNFISIQEELYPNFDINRATFAQISYLFFKTNFNQLIELRINKPVTWSKKLPWKEIRQLRNYITHTDLIKVNRSTALDFIRYVNTYLEEVKLLENVYYLGEEKCYSCGEPVDKTWNYCPNCGASLSDKCSTCGQILKPEWIICPVCHTPRAAVYNTDPAEIYEYYCEAAWSDGVISPAENAFLLKKRDEMELSKKVAEEIEQKYAPLNAIRFRDIVEISLLDGHIDEKEKEFLQRKAHEFNLDEHVANAVYKACLKQNTESPLFEVSQ